MKKRLSFALVGMSLIISVILMSAPVFADVNTDIEEIEAELGLDNADKTIIERISYIEEQLGVKPKNGSSVINRVHVLKSELGLNDNDEKKAEELDAESADAESEEPYEGEPISEDDIGGNYIEKDHGNSLRIEDDYCYYEHGFQGFCFRPFEHNSNYEIVGNKLKTNSTEEGFDSFEIQISDGSVSLVNDKYHFIPEEEFYLLEDKEKHTVSETVSCDRASLTVTNVSLIENDIDPYVFVTEQWFDSYIAKIPIHPRAKRRFMEIDIDVENTSNSSFILSDILSLSIVYDSSFVFHSYDEDGNSIVKEPMLYLFTSQGGSEGNSINVSPLDTISCKIFMQVPFAVRDNPDKSAYGVFRIADVKGVTDLFVYDLRS